MKGYAGREAPPTERLTVGKGRNTLLTAIEQIKIAQTFLELREAAGMQEKQKFLRVDPERYGVNFVSYNAESGKITGLTEIGSMPDKLLDLVARDQAVVYPAAPFITIPTQLLVQYPVIIIVRFADHLAYRLVTKPGAAGIPARVGLAKLSDDHEETTLVLSLDSSQFKIVDRQEEP